MTGSLKGQESRQCSHWPSRLKAGGSKPVGTFSSLILSAFFSASFSYWRKIFFVVVSMAIVRSALTQSYPGRRISSWAVSV